MELRFHTPLTALSTFSLSVHTIVVDFLPIFLREISYVLDEKLRLKLKYLGDFL